MKRVVLTYTREKRNSQLCSTSLSLELRVYYHLLLPRYNRVTCLIKYLPAVRLQAFTKVKEDEGLSLVAKSCLILVTPWTVAHQAPLSMGFSRQEHWSGLPFPPPGNLPNPGIQSASPALAGGFFTTEPCGKPIYCIRDYFFQLPRVILLPIRVLGLLNK